MEGAAKPDTPATQGSRGRRTLGRIGLIVWLAMPFVLVGALWMMVDRSKGRPDPQKMRHPHQGRPAGADGAAGAEAEATPKDGRASGGAPAP